MCGRENMLPSELNSDAPGCFFGVSLLARRMNASISLVTHLSLW